MAPAGPVAGSYPSEWPSIEQGRHPDFRSNKPVITVDDIDDLPPTCPSQRPDVSSLSSFLLERVSKYLTFAARHDPKTPTAADEFIMLRDVCRRTLVVRALKDLAQSGVPANEEVVASIAMHLSETSKMRFEVKYSQTRGLCLRAIAGHSTVLDPCRNLPLLRHDEVRRILTAMHCTTWDNLDSVLARAFSRGTWWEGLARTSTLPLSPWALVALRMRKASVLPRWP